MTLPELGISLSGSPALALRGFILAAGCAILFYRTTIPASPPRTRIVLASLRGLVVTLLVFLAFEPLLTLLTRRNQTPVLAVLLDDSESMTIQDRGAARSIRVREIFERNPLERVPAAVSFFRFSDRLIPHPVTHPDSLTFRGETTDLAAALTSVAALGERENIRAVVVVTDGDYTIGQNPLAAIDNLDFPVYTVGVGDTISQKDVLISRVATNKIVYAGTRVPVEVRLNSSGFEGSAVEVSLSHGGAVVDHKPVRLAKETMEHAVSLSYEPLGEGTQKYTVNVSSLPGELTERNNQSTFFVSVLRSKLRILLVAGAPSPDVSMVRQILSEDENFSVQALVQKDGDEFYGGSLTQASIDTADCIVLVGFPSTATPVGVVQILLDAATEKRKPLLFAASRTLDFQKLRILESLLPFTWSVPVDLEVLVFPYIPEHARHHGLVRLGEQATADHWGQLPPLYKTQTTFRAKPESDVLATVSIRAAVSSEPLILVRNVARLRSFAFTGHGIWRWRLSAQGNPATAKLLPLLLTSAVRWLTAPDDEKRVRVVPTKEAFTGAEAVEFTGEVYDEQLRPVDNADLRVEIAPAKTGPRIRADLRTVGSGRYEGSIGGLGPGDYTFTATAMREGSILGEDKGRFSIGQLNVEFLETRMNRTLLEQLAFRTGGSYADVAGVQSLADSIVARTSFASKEIVTTSEVELWNWGFLAAFIVVLLGAEWVIRKRNGML